MNKKSRQGWFKNGLFWRTFLLLTFLVTASVVAWLASFRMFETGPRAEQMAAQVTSLVTITRAALTHSAPEMRRELLFDLASNEGIRIYPLEATDKIVPLEVHPIMPGLEDHITDTLGSDTLFASSVNDVKGFWISFQIEGDEYWLMIDRGRLDQTTRSQWLRWVSVALTLSLIGAALISALINQPLARLTAAARAVAKGAHPSPLPESGPTEIEEANRSFNQMVSDLARIESDRAVILAGISHDLRTPLARMQLEIEMANLTAQSRSDMQSDLAQMDAIISQFLDYAKPSTDYKYTHFNLSELVENIAMTAMRLPNVSISTNIEKSIMIDGNPTDFERILNNLIENARRYGKTPESNLCEVEVTCHANHTQAIIEVSDHGNGVPESQLDQLLLPFIRLDAARGQANGSGLGLAIVNRIALRHNGSVSLFNSMMGGLTVRVTLPLKQQRT